MDEDLAHRYFGLFMAYEAGCRGELAVLKQRLLRTIQSGDLRPDAALCLLTLLDQMILRPYAGQIAAGPSLEDIPLPSIARDAGAFAERVDRAFAIIGGELERLGRPRPWSSHDALRAIEGGWPALSVSFAWG